MKNNFNISDLMLFLTSINFFIGPLLSISEVLISRSLIIKHIDQLNFLFNLKTRKNFEQGITLDNIKKISLINCKYNFEIGKDVIKIKNLIIDKNTQLKGKNGSGKSTLMNLILNNYSDYSGLIMFNDISLQNLNVSKLLNKIIYIKNNEYFSNEKIINLITYNNEKFMKNLNENINKYGLFKILNDLEINLNALAMNNGANLSSGQKQIISLLKLFTQKYNIIMLDEAFENIDENSYKTIANAIKNYQNNAIFIEISHSKKYLYNENEVDFEKINCNY
ncbi:UNVERIFIED_CONTAM: ATP-binding cassette domain-containing protein [Campylobacter lari]